MKQKKQRNRSEIKVTIVAQSDRQQTVRWLRGVLEKARAGRAEAKKGK